MSRRWRNSSFSRSGSGGSKQDYIGETIYSRMDTLLNNRWKALCPFDVVKDPVVDLFSYAMSPEQRDAWNLLCKHDGFKNSIRVNDSFDIRHAKAGFYIRVYTQVGVPVWTLPWENLPSELAEKLLHWQIMSRAYRDEYELIKAKVKSLLRMCNTPGQVERVWPELLGFMPAETVDKRIDKKALSPYPSGVLRWDSERLNAVLNDDWTRERLSWFDNAIAEALILPEYEDADDAPAYPTIHDL